MARSPDTRPLDLLTRVLVSMAGKEDTPELDASIEMVERLGDRVVMYLSDGTAVTYTAIRKIDPVRMNEAI